ncbi:MAG: SBBP repeat-containing protein, partial [Bacteroidota bacterium]
KIDNEAESKKRVSALMSNRAVRFIENKGQLTNTENKPVPFVLFKAETPGMNVYITEKGLTYVFSKTELQNAEDDLSKEAQVSENQELKALQAAQKKYKTEMAWINVNLKNANIKRENIIKEGQSSEHFNFFYGHCPDGLSDVYEYEKITIKNIYPSIDWVIYQSTKNGMKYDFIVHPGADPKQIRLLYESEKPLNLDKAGNISITTALGTLTENAPYSYLQESKKEIKSSFIKTPINEHQVEVSFKLLNDNNQTKAETLIIDPQLVWGTYYGSNTSCSLGPGDGSEMTGVDNDAFGNLFVTGFTFNNFFPTFPAGGATYYQFVMGNISNVTDIIILKFSNTGQRLWVTYYGGNNVDYATSIKVDGLNNVFITGNTFSSNFPLCGVCLGYFSNVTIIAAQVVFLKFDNSGNRLWATLFGGTTGFDSPYGSSLAFDSSNNLIAVGYTFNANFPMFGTPFQPTFGGGGFNFDAFIVKFNNTGNPIWSTFYGGSGSDQAYGVEVDVNDNIIVTGATTSTNFPTTAVGVPTAASYNQAAPSAGTDAFILKFDTNGNRLWASCYGGTSTDRGTSVACDAAGNIFIGGNTTSTNLPITPAGVPLATSYNQAANAGGGDVFITKFDKDGVRLWATYFGGTLLESSIGGGNAPTDTELGIDQCGNIHFVFSTRSTNIPVLNPSGSVCGYFDNSYGTGGVWAISDNFLTKFTNNGQLLFASYIGGQGWEMEPVISFDNSNNFFIGGVSAGVSTGFPLNNPGAPAYFDGAVGAAKVTLHKFIPLVPSYTVSSSNPTGCVNNGSVSIAICGDAPYSFVWNTGLSTSSSTLSSSSIPNLGPGVYQVTVTSGCTLTATRS